MTSRRSHIVGGGGGGGVSSKPHRGAIGSRRKRDGRQPAITGSFFQLRKPLLAVSFGDAAAGDDGDGDAGSEGSDIYSGLC